jgi:gamma-tubulin complex component 3
MPKVQRCHRKSIALRHNRANKQDDLYAHSLAEMTRLDRTRDQARGLASSPGDEYDNDARSTFQLNQILKRLAVLKSDFKSRMDLITQLTAQHQDLDIRFLAIRLAFNGFWGKKERDGKSRPSRKG